MQSIILAGTLDDVSSREFLSMEMSPCGGKDWKRCSIENMEDGSG